MKNKIMSNYDDVVVICPFCKIKIEIEVPNYEKQNNLAIKCRFCGSPIQLAGNSYKVENSELLEDNT